MEDMAEGIYRLMNSEHTSPLNLSVDGMVTINHVADILNKISGKKLSYRHNLKGPQGVRGRQSDTSTMKEVLNWSPKVSLSEGLEKTYNWISSKLEKN